MLSDLDEDELEEIESRLYSQIYYKNESATQEADTTVAETTPLQYQRMRYFKSNQSRSSYIPYSPLIQNKQQWHAQHLQQQNSGEHQVNNMESEKCADDLPIPEYININENSGDSANSTDFQINPMCMNENQNNTRDNDLSKPNTIMDLLVNSGKPVNNSVQIFNQFSKKPKPKSNKLEKHAKIWEAANNAELFRTLSFDERKAVLKYQKRQRYKERKKLRMLEKNQQWKMENVPNLQDNHNFTNRFNTQESDDVLVDVVSLSGSDGSSCVAVEAQNEVLVISDSEPEVNNLKLGVLEDVKEKVESVQNENIEEIKGSVKDGVDDEVIFVETKAEPVIDLDTESSSNLTELPVAGSLLKDSELMKPPDFETLSVCSIQSLGLSSKTTPKKLKPAVNDSAESGLGKQNTPKKIARERDDLLSTPESNDFLDTTLSGEQNFNFSLHGADFDVSKSTPNKKTFAEICESESSCSASDISAPVKSIVFNEIEFDTPSKELFSENNLDSFSDFITPKRASANLQIAPLLTSARELFEQVQTKALCRSVSEQEDSSSSESDYEHGKSAQVGGKNLPELSHFEKDNPAKKSEKKKKCTKDKKAKKAKDLSENDDVCKEQNSKKKKLASTPKRGKVIESNVLEEEINKTPKRTKSAEETPCDDQQGEGKRKKISKNLEDLDTVEEIKRKKKGESTPKRITEDSDDPKKKKKIKKKKRVAEEWIEDDDDYEESTTANISAYLEFEEESHSQFPETANNLTKDVVSSNDTNKGKTKKGGKKSDNEDNAMEETVMDEDKRKRKSSEGRKTPVEEFLENQEKSDGIRKRRISDKRNTDNEENAAEETLVEEDKRKKKTSESRKSPEKETVENREEQEKCEVRRKRRTSDKRNPEENDTNEKTTENLESVSNESSQTSENHKRKRKPDQTLKSGEKSNEEQDKDSKKRRKSPSKNSCEESETAIDDQDGKRKRKCSENGSKKTTDEVEDPIDGQDKTGEAKRNRKSSDTTTKNTDPASNETPQCDANTTIANPCEDSNDNEESHDVDNDDSDVEIIERSFEVIDVDDSGSEADRCSTKSSSSSSGFDCNELDNVPIDKLELANFVGVNKKRTDGTKGKTSGAEIMGLSDMLKLDMKEFYSSTFGAEKMDVEDWQRLMSDNPKDWRISDRDRYNLNFDGDRGPRCRKCRQIGHIAVHCTEKTGPPICCLCGGRGHYEPRCPNKCCTQCGRSSFETAAFCSKCAYMKKSKCSLCKLTGHEKHLCPDGWRRYHLTTEGTCRLQGCSPRFKPKKSQWCSGCGNNGHLEYQCWYYIRQHPPALPAVVQYKDLYDPHRNSGKDKTEKDSPTSPSRITSQSESTQTPKRNAEASEHICESGKRDSNNSTPKSHQRRTLEGLDATHDISGINQSNTESPMLQLSGGKPVENILIKENQTVNLHIHGNYVNIQSPIESTIPTTDFYKTLLNCNKSELNSNQLVFETMSDKLNDGNSNTECILFTDQENVTLSKTSGKQFLCNLRKKYHLPLELVHHDKMGLACILVKASKHTSAQIKQDLMDYLHENKNVYNIELFTTLKYYLEFLAKVYLDYERPSDIFERLLTDPSSQGDYVKLNAIIYGVHELGCGKKKRKFLIEAYSKFNVNVRKRNKFSASDKMFKKAFNFLFAKKRSVFKYLELLQLLKAAESRAVDFSKELSPKGKEKPEVWEEDGSDSESSLNDLSFFGLDNLEVTQGSSSVKFNQAESFCTEIVTCKRNYGNNMKHCGFWKQFRFTLKCSNQVKIMPVNQYTYRLTGKQSNVSVCVKRLKVFFENYQDIFNFPMQIKVVKEKCFKSVAMINVWAHTKSPSAIYKEILQLERAANTEQDFRKIGELYVRLNAILYGKYQVDELRRPSLLIEILRKFPQPASKHHKLLPSHILNVKFIYFHIFDFVHKGVDYEAVLNKYRKFDYIACGGECPETKDALVKKLEQLLILAKEREDFIAVQEISTFLGLINKLQNLNGVAVYVRELINSYR